MGDVLHGLRFNQLLSGILQLIPPDQSKDFKRQADVVASLVVVAKRVKEAKDKKVRLSRTFLIWSHTNVT